MNKFNGFRTFYRNAEGGGSGGGAAPAGGAPASVTTNADAGKSAAATVSTTMGEAAQASQQGNSASASVPSTVGAQPPAATPDFKTALGEFGKDPALADFKDAQSLAKSYLETKKLVGQKLGIPDANATPEAKAAFYKALGVPDKPEEYGFKKPDNLPEGVEYDEKDAAEWAGVFKELNVPASVANALRDRFVKQYIEGVSKTAEAMKADQTTSDANFDEVTKKTFGDKRDAYLQAARTDIERYGSKELREMVSNLPNAGLALIAQVVTGIRKELGGEDSVITGDSAGTAKSEGELRQELRDIYANPAFNSPFVKGKEEHQRLRDEAKRISQAIAAGQAARAKK